MKNKQDKINFLNSIKKETEVHSLLEELLPEMGFKDVKITHEKGNKPEFGKDLVCSKQDEIENKKDWYAFVVKKGSVSGSSGVVREIDNQIAECFKYPYKSIDKNKKIPINKVKVVTNMHFSAGAKDKIFDGNSEDRANIDFWDGEKLIYFIDEYYPKFWIKGSKSYKKYIEIFQEKIVTDNAIKALTIDNSKVQKIYTNLIEPIISERVKNEDGSIKWSRRSASTVINFPNNSIIVGDPGSGKTTILKTLSNEIITQNSLRNDQEFYPLIITFQEIKENGFNIEKTIESYFKKDWNIKLNIDFQHILKTNSCVLFIDALDELPDLENKEKALDSVTNFNKSYPNIKVICTSRPSDYLFQNCETIGFRFLQINDLNRQQIETFLNNYFSNDLIKSKSLLKSLKDSEILDKLPKTPLTIALITILFDEKEIEIPATITDLYEHFVNLLIGKTTFEETVELIEIGVKHRLLCYIAKDMHTKSKSSITREQFNELINRYSKERGQGFDKEQVITEILDRVGLLYINDKNEISFKHQSFQEYFTAYEIFHHRQSDRKLFVNNFNDLWWQNVAIFYAGMTKDSPALLDEILESSKPQSLQEYVSNIGGIGRLLQALFNTPIENREKGIIQGLTNVNSAINYICGEPVSSEKREIQFFHQFSKYGLMQIFGGWFKHNFWSITLKEPLANYFDQNIIDIEQPSDENSFNLQFSLFLASSILASDTFMDFSKFKELVEKSDLSDLDILATFHNHLEMLLKVIPKEYKKDEDIKTISRKLRKRLQYLDGITEKVNKPLKDRKELE